MLLQFKRKRGLNPTLTQIHTSRVQPESTGKARHALGPLGAVALVAHNGPSRLDQMTPKLVFAARDQLQFQLREALETLENPVAGLRSKRSLSSLIKER